MARCGQCGTTNRDGSAFCQNCGQKMAAEEPKAKPAPSGGPTCGTCGTANNPGMNFCKMCGSSLAAAAAPAAAAARVVCSSCGKQTPTGFTFCQHCGQKLSSLPGAGPKSGVHDKPSVAATMMAEAPVLPTFSAKAVSTPPAGMPRPGSAPAPSSAAFASTLGPGGLPPEIASTLLGEGDVAGVAQSTVKTSPVPAGPIVAERVYATLIVVRRDGSDGESVRVTTPVFDVGRSEGGLTFTDDIYLASRHLRLSFEGSSPLVRALDPVNGIYVRLRAAVELHPGDHFLVGKEVIRYEPVTAEERDAAVSEHGVRLFGTVPREAWGRLRQLTGSGTTRDVWHLSRPDLVLGREEGDVTFPDDEFMSRRHAAVHRGVPRPKLEDLSSSNGTFVRVRGDHPLKSGDLLRLGDQLLRVEI